MLREHSECAQKLLWLSLGNFCLLLSLVGQGVVREADLWTETSMRGKLGRQRRGGQGNNRVRLKFGKNVDRERKEIRVNSE